MGTIVNLDSSIKSTVQTVFDDLLLPASQGGLGKTCLLVYPPKVVPCSNCSLDPVGGRSTNRYRTGGPVPFPSSQPCPMCNGSGRFRQEEVTEEIVLRCEWKPKDFSVPFPGVELKAPYSVMETKGYVADIPKLVRCDHLVADLPTAPYLRQKFKRKGEPGSPGNIIQGRYCVCHWERFNG